MESWIDWDYNSSYQRKKRKQIKDKKKKHEEIIRMWREKKISWNEYIRLEKKYRVN